MGRCWGGWRRVGPAAGFAGGRAVGEHACPHVPVTAHAQQGKGPSLFAVFLGDGQNYLKMKTVHSLPVFSLFLHFVASKCPTLWTWAAVLVPRWVEWVPKCI